MGTGSPGSNAGCQSDSSILGTDYLVVLQSGFGKNQAQIYKATGGCNHFQQVGNAPVTIVTDGMDVTFPLSLLNNTASATTSGPATSGPWNFKVTTDSNIGGNSFSGVQDTMPDVGVVASTNTGSAVVNLTPQGAGSFIAGQSFNEIRAMDIRVVPNKTLAVTSMTLNGFSIGNDSSATVGARIYSTQGTLIASQDVNVTAGGQVTVPISATLSAGGTYRVGFYLNTSSGSGGSGTFFQPSGDSFVAPATFSFPPYLGQASGWFEVLAAWDSATDVFPTNGNLDVPQITIAVTDQILQ